MTREQIEKEARKVIRREVVDRSDEELIWVMCTLADTLYEDYHWKESPDNNHGQITSFLERFVNRMNRFAAEGYSTKELTEMIDQKMGIILIPDKKWKQKA